MAGKSSSWYHFFLLCRLVLLLPGRNRVITSCWCPVTERTREIGTRQACRDMRDIVRQFFADSSMLTRGRGLLGLTSNVTCTAMGALPLPDFGAASDIISDFDRGFDSDNFL